MGRDAMSDPNELANWRPGKFTEEWFDRAVND
jgi:hypothetical protein